MSGPHWRVAPFCSKPKHWLAVLRGPIEGPYHGGVFSLDIDLSSFHRPIVKFQPPIHHCNVNPNSGVVGFSVADSHQISVSELLSIVLALLVTPDVSSIKNPAAFDLYEHNRLEYDSLARQDASRFWRAALAEESKSMPDVYELFLPPCKMSRAAQHQVFEKVALQEIGKECEVPPQTPSPLSNDVRIHFADLESQRLKRQLQQQQLARRAAQFNENLTEALLELASIANPEYEQKMATLEREMTEAYLVGNVKESCAGWSSGLMLEMITKAQEEGDRLSKLMKICFTKYESLCARFNLLKLIPEEKEAVVQSCDESVEFFVSQSKSLEPSFRSILMRLVDDFNRGILPSSLANLPPNSSSPPPFSDLLKLASGHRVKVLFAPAKSVERVKQKIGLGAARQVTDYLRATVVMADPALLAMFHLALATDSHHFSIKRCKNKLLFENLKEPPNVHLNLEFRGHIGEIQLILEDFMLIKEYSHKVFELTRIGVVGENLVAGAALQQAVKYVASTGVYVLHPGKEDYPQTAQ